MPIPPVWRMLRLCAVVIMVTILAITGHVAGASADPDISTDREINQGLFVIVVANKIRKKCDTIDARMWRALMFIENLKAKARARGYTRPKVEAYLNNEEARAHMDDLRDAYIKQHVGDTSPESLCRLGREEIARNSQIGYLLKAE